MGFLLTFPADRAVTPLSESGHILDYCVFLPIMWSTARYSLFLLLEYAAQATVDLVFDAPVEN